MQRQKSHLSEFLGEPVDLGAAPVVLLEGAAGERAGRAAAHEAEPVEEQRLTELFAAEGPESASTERDSQGGFERGLSNSMSIQ